MENAPAIHLVGFELPPDPDARQRVRNWTENAHLPLFKKVHGGLRCPVTRV
jgi:hypothetical protein